MAARHFLDGLARAGSGRRLQLGLLAAALAALLAACEGVDVRDQYPEKRGNRVDPSPSAPQETVFGPGGLSFLSLGDTGREAGEPLDGSGGVAVNSFLWRASLDTMSFMPLTSADPFGGVIITDWYSPPETPDERFKATVYILERQLRANGVRVALFRQTRDGADGWRDAGTSEETAVALENAILTRARQLRVSAVSSQ